MTEALICSTEFGSFVDNTVIPLSLLASMATILIVALSFMFGRALSNAKLTLWAKTEVIQVIVSAASVFFIILTINTFCGMNMNDISQIFLETPAQDINVYDAAQEYLREAALYSHNAMTVIRYHLQAYTVLSFINAFQCDFPVGPIGIGCWYGYSGTSMQPLGGYGASIAALNIFFNGMIIAHFTALNFLFILLFIYKGFAFLFLPFGIFMRSMPYMRQFGSLMIALALSFLVVYPLILSIFYLMGPVVVDRPHVEFGDPEVRSFFNKQYVPDSSPDLDNYLDETVFPEQEVSGALDALGFVFGNVGDTIIGAQDAFSEEYFPEGPNLIGAIGFGANAFIAAVFLPTAALIAAIASVSYTARLYGEEIDLSRITRLM